VKICEEEKDDVDGKLWTILQKHAHHPIESARNGETDAGYTVNLELNPRNTGLSIKSGTVF